MERGTEQMQSFADKVKSIVKKIPKGRVLTYAQVASKAGSPGASRAVGTIMAKNLDLDIPCHRVIGSNGKIGNYNRGGTNVKRQLLIKEGAL